MITKEEIIAEFDIKDGIIQNPGKFEGEPIHTVHYYELMMDGEGEDIYDDGVATEDAEPEYTQFVVDADESDMFGLRIGSEVRVWVDSQGFVVSNII